MDWNRSKEIPGFQGYFVDEDGMVWTTKKKGGNDRAAGQRGAPRPMRTHTNRAGYVIVGLDCSGRNLARAVHRLVLEAHVGPCPPGMEACHYPDPDPANNRLANLRWDTHLENARDKERDRPVTATKECRRCRQSKERALFYADKRASDGLQTECKRCHAETAMRSRDPDKKRAYNREHMRRSRAKKKQAP